MPPPDATFDRLVTILTEDFQVPTSAITEDSHLRTDLGLDSLSLTDLAFLVQRDFGFMAAAEDFRGVTTVGALAGFIAAKTAVSARE